MKRGGKGGRNRGREEGKEEVLCLETKLQKVKEYGGDGEEDDSPYTERGRASPVENMMVHTVLEYRAFSVSERWQPIIDQHPTAQTTSGHMKCTKASTHTSSYQLPLNEAHLHNHHGYLRFPAACPSPARWAARRRGVCL